MPNTVKSFATIRTPSAFPASRKQYQDGERPGLRVPYRAISLSSMQHRDRLEENPPLPVYDTSGPYTDPETTIDLASGLSDVRGTWIAERGDTQELDALGSRYGRERQNDLLNYHLRFPSMSRPRRAIGGLNVTQMHYARKGIVTPEMEFVALRESMQLDRLSGDPAYAPLLRQHRGQSFGGELPKQMTPEFVRTEVAAGRAIIPANINHPELEPMIIGRNFNRGSTGLSELSE